MATERNGEVIQIWVPGIPQPGGSKKGFVYFDKAQQRHRPALTEDNRKSKPWREAVAWAAKENFSQPLLGAIEITYKFFMPRPKSHFGRKGLLPSAPSQHTVKPDVTKLIRSTEDAMKGIAWLDDSNVVDQHGRKVYGHRPGALITIKVAEPVGDEEAARDEGIVRQLGMRFLGMGG